MRAPTPLPEPFSNGPFRASAARSAGVSRSRTRRGDLVAPFRDVRATSIESVGELASAYAVRMHPDHVFGGVTAARLWGLPLPTDWTPEEPLVVARPNGTTRSAVRGTRQIGFDASRIGVGGLRGVPILGPLGTVLTLARELPHEPLVHVVDALLTPSRRYPDLELPRRPHTTPAALDACLARWAGLSGVTALRAAAADARVGVDSRFETITRRLIVLAGLPEPIVHAPVLLDGILLHPDLAYPDLRIAIEYEGDDHRGFGRWVKDIERYAMLEAARWIVVRITRADMPRDGRRCVRRVAAAISRRS